MSSDGGTTAFRYKFSFDNGTSKEFVLNLDRKTFRLVADPLQSPPDWTLLDCNKCPNCPLNSPKTTYCPVALSVVDVVGFFKDAVSYEKTYVMIESETRTYIAKVSVQEGIKSLVSIYMVASDCPILSRLRPMLRAHLPFPTMEESIYRLVSMYLLAQYFLFREGKKADWELKDLLAICGDVQTVNRSFFKRLRGEKVKDASLNALVALDSFVAYAASFLEDNSLKDVKTLFGPYLDDFRV